MMFTLDEARTRLAALMPQLEELIGVRADLAELRADLDTGGQSELGGLAEAKALEARLYAALEEIADADIEVKGFAPLLLDFPGELDGRPVRWCWLEGDDGIDWYHRNDTGFAGRRPC